MFKSILILFLAVAISSNLALSMNRDEIQLPPVYEVAPDLATCLEGSLKNSERQKIVDYINKIRAIHGLKPVIYDYAGDEAAQKGAMACVANNDIEHNMPSNWQCFSEKAKYGTLNSNLYIIKASSEINAASESSIISWMIDKPFSDVGHRRAIINPFVSQISFGRVDGKPKVSSQNSFASAMTLKYLDNLNQTVSDMDIEYVAYPYHDYPPLLVDKTFYLSFHAVYDKVNWWNNNKVDYSGAQITVTGPNNTQLNVHSATSDNVGWGGLSNALVWKVDGMQDGITYNVSITNVKINNQTKSYSYWFNLREPQEQAPEQVILAFPINNQTNVDQNAELSWNKSQFADSYLIEVSNNQNFSSKVISDESTSTNFTAQGLAANTKYYWRIAAKNSIGTSDWSTVWSFTTKANISPVPLPLEPVNNATNVVLEPKFKWSKMNTATEYHLMVATNTEFSPSSRYIDNQSIKDTFYTVPASSQLPPKKKLYWRVKRVLPTESAWSEVFSFTTLDPTSVEDQEQFISNSILECVPNPASNLIKISLMINNQSSDKLLLFDIKGNIILEKAINTNVQGQIDALIDISAIPSGSYYLQLTGSNDSVKLIEVIK